jgi:hypothetical protein
MYTKDGVEYQYHCVFVAIRFTLQSFQRPILGLASQGFRALHDYPRRKLGAHGVNDVTFPIILGAYGINDMGTFPNTPCALQCMKTT